jgi:hypothetical protein
VARWRRRVLAAALRLAPRFLIALFDPVVPTAPALLAAALDGVSDLFGAGRKGRAIRDEPADRAALAERPVPGETGG